MAHGRPAKLNVQTLAAEQPTHAHEHAASQILGGGPGYELGHPDRLMLYLECLSLMEQAEKNRAQGSSCLTG